LLGPYSPISRDCCTRLPNHPRWVRTWYSKFLHYLQPVNRNKLFLLFCVGGSWPSGERGALACRRSQVQIPTVAVNQPFVLICC
jgi:hypothetical protein